MGVSLHGLLSLAEAVGRDVRPAAQLLFLLRPDRRPQKSNQKKADPTGRVPALRFGQPAVLTRGEVLQNSLCSLRSLRSNNCSKLVHEARASCSALSLPSRSVPRHVQRGRGPDSGHCFARPWMRCGPLLCSAWFCPFPSWGKVGMGARAALKCPYNSRFRYRPV